MLQINALNDSHQQLMVHWVGEGSNVIICLARDSTPVKRMLHKFATTSPPTPSAVYISYDYGNTFVNKTDKFRISSEPDAPYATLDKFTNHPKFYRYVSLHLMNIIKLTKLVNYVHHLLFSSVSLWTVCIAYCSSRLTMAKLLKGYKYHFIQVRSHSLICNIKSSLLSTKLIQCEK